MTLRDYLDPTLFPLTTIPGASLWDQCMADGLTFDGFEETPPETPEDQARYKEVAQKVRAWSDPEIGKEIAEAREKSQTSPTQP